MNPNHIQLIQLALHSQGLFSGKISGVWCEQTEAGFQSYCLTNSGSKRLAMASKILEFEARRDVLGRLKVYAIPSGDGGGAYEVAGICDRYHPAAAGRLKWLIEEKRFVDAEREAIEYIAQYTDCVAKWSKNPAVEFFLRDTAFNRGPTGSAKILQKACGVSTDGKVGPKTLAALAIRENAISFLDVLRDAREWYEEEIVGTREKFAKGLENRWAKARKASDLFV